MANPEHLAILKQGVEVWNHWRAENPDLIPNLSGNLNRRTDLCSLNLCRFNFLRAYLHWVNFADADLTNASFDAAWLTGSNFQGARLKEASFIYAHLIGANFQNADLTEGELTRANCNGADFRGAQLNSVVLNETILTDVKFAGCTGLDSCQHQGPGRIDYNTIIKSGPLPLIFLQGCGIPDQLSTIYRRFLINLFSSTPASLATQRRIRTLLIVFTQISKLRVSGVGLPHMTFREARRSMSR